MITDYTDISIVLDRSGSMASVRDDTIGGYNTFLSEQKAILGPCTLTLVQFDTEYECIYKAVPVQSVTPLDTQTFIPRGGTALLDAIGRTVLETGARLSAMPENDRPGKVLFVILTDGEENSSHEFTIDRIHDMIKHQREVYKWQFVFLGANQDAIATGTSMGVQPDSSLTYAASPMGTAALFDSLAANTRNYRTGQTQDASFSQADRDAQKKAGA